jgi:hypothetical protein
MEAVRTSKTSVDNNFTRQYIPEDNSEHHTRRRENLKSHISNHYLAERAPDIVASTVFGLLPWWADPICGPLNEGRKREETIKFIPYPPSFAAIPSSKLEVSDSLRGSNSNISEAKSAGAG